MLGISPIRALDPTEPATSITAATAPAASSDPFQRHKTPTDEELDRLLKSGFATEVKVDRVIVPAVVVDRKGKPVHGLRLQDFKLSEDLVPQTIDYFHVDIEESISIAFLLDVSGSMRVMDKIGEAREAIRSFLDDLNGEDQAALLTFADGQVETIAPFGTKPSAILGGLASIKAYGQTALNDAIAGAPGIVYKARRGRKAIVLITDGVDNFSKMSLREAMTTARRVDVPIYALGFASDPKALDLDPSQAGRNAEILRHVSEETGGGFFLIHDPDEMKEAVRSVQEDLRSQYVLGYTPPRAQCDGSFRRIDLTVAKDRYRVRTRKGYFSGPC